MKNPVLMREINTMFRTYKVFIAIGLYGLAVLGLTALMLFGMVFNKYNGFDPQDIIYTFCGVVGLQTGVIFLAVPAFASSAISGERERQTLDLMLLTKMKPFSIVSGKLLSSLLLISVMVFIAMPVYGIFFYYGGISLLDLIFALVFDFSYAMAIGAMSILLSSIFKKTVTATVLSYIILIFYPSISIIIIGIAFSFLSYSIKVNSLGYIPTSIVASVNPIMSFLSLIGSFTGENSLSYLFDSASGGNLSIIKPWHITVVLNVIVAYILLKLAAYVINPIKNSKRK